MSKKYFFLSFCNSNACLFEAPTKILPVASIVSLVVQSGAVLRSATANLIRTVGSHGEFGYFSE